MICSKRWSIVLVAIAVFTADILLVPLSNKNVIHSAAMAAESQVVTGSALEGSTGFSVTDIAPDIAVEMKIYSWHNGCPVQIKDLRQVFVKYHDYAGNEKSGSLIVHKKLAAEVRDIFRELYNVHFRINSIERIDAFHGDDNLSMQADNTSAFNFRSMPGSKKLSNHAWGMAVDINPLRNPYVTKQGVLPTQGKAWLNRKNVRLGMIIKGDACYKAFTKRGWKWGGNYKSLKDYQHFEKAVY